MKKVLLALFVFLSLSLNAVAGVNINTATQAELESLDGIGPKKALAIIDYRKKNGGFKTVDDLKNVDGIGNTTLENLRKNISITGTTTAVAPKAKNTVKAIKPAKDVKAVGNEKAAASGKTAQSKVAK
jgi:competence protein ComEA